MPLDTKAIISRVQSGKPFITGRYLGMSFSELMCKVKGNPNLKENRIVLKHTVSNANGIHVYTEFLPPGTVIEKDSGGVITKAVLPDRSERTQAIKSDAEVVIDLFKYQRDGVGLDVMGDLHVVTATATPEPKK